MRKFRLVAALLAVVSLLSACTVVITGSPSYNATVGRGSALVTTSLAPGSTHWYHISLPEMAPTVDAAYFEITKNLDITLYESDQTTIDASSHSPYVFAAGTLGLQALGVQGSRISPQDIGTQPICVGSCIIQPANAKDFWLKVYNQGSSSVTYSLYSYVKNYQDTGEPDNTLSTAVPLSVGQDFQAGLEYLGDLDYYTFNNSGYFQLTGCTHVDFQAVVHFSGGGTQNAVLNGSSVPVGPNDYVIVSSASGDYAAQATACSYYASLKATP